MNSAIASTLSQIRDGSDEQSAFAGNQNGKAGAMNASLVSSRSADSLKSFVLTLLRSLAVGAA